jgi:GrpB-like predicted nucleotidyltransferase (UPF0157 family)
MNDGGRIEVVPYDGNWPQMFEAEKATIVTALGDNLAAIHHVGSTSVPGLAAKPIIDIIALGMDRKRAIADLAKIGYEFRGEWNVPLKCGFKKKGPVNINLHMFFDGNHPEGELNLKFRDYLRAHPDARDQYAAIKYEILTDETCQRKVGIFPAYTLKKSAFIRDIIGKTGFNRARVLKCATEDEWNAAKDLRRKHFPTGNKMSAPDHGILNLPGHEHFVLYEGAEIAGYAHIRLDPKSMEAMLYIAVGGKNHGQNFESEFLSTIKKWIKLQGYDVSGIVNFVGGKPFSLT